jgi:hypothetical protein
MKKNILLGIALILLPLSLAAGDIVTASSNSFIFPSAVGIKGGTAIANAIQTNHFTFSARPGIMGFSWSVAYQSQVKSGKITIYSLNGRTVKTFAISAKTGSLSWKAPNKETPAGIYIAKLSFGSSIQNLKLVLY